MQHRETRKPRLPPRSKPAGDKPTGGRMARRARATEADATQERLAYRVAGFSRSTIERAIKDGS